MIELLPNTITTNQLKYKLYYVSIINRAKGRLKVKGEMETHHIIPRAWFKSHENLKSIKEQMNTEENLVHLTFREHFLAHCCLAHAYPYDRSVIAAMSFMSKGSSKYERSRRKFSILISGQNNPACNPIVRAKISKSLKEYPAAAFSPSVSAARK